ncbi:MAG: hypothetical protein RBS24_02690 [Bacilli bacterium]|nr:hypothetical protein [Bacilli bacterium]
MALFNPRKYYVVTCKFGHVGRDKYLPLDVPIKAFNKKEASEKAKKLGGVKRDHPDWCLKEPQEITREEYDALRIILTTDPYWNKKTRQNIALFKDRLVDEPNYTNIRGVKTNTVSFKKPTTAEIKMFHKKKRKIIEKEIDDLLNEDIE